MPTRGAKGPRVDVVSPRRRGVRSASLKRAARFTLAKAGPDVHGDVAVLLTDDATIRRLNRRYRDVDRPTDVLAFELGDGRRPAEPFGDVVISIETAARQAREYGATLEQEVLRLLVHGTLHLCGHDHRNARGAARMHGLARAILRHLARDG